MSLNEASHHQANETTDPAKERSEVLAQTGAEISLLKSEVVAETALREPVIQTLKGKVPADYYDRAVTLAHQMQLDNPAVFTVPDDILLMVLDPIIRQSEIAARTERIQEKKAENTDKREELAEINTDIDVLSNDTVSEQSDLNDKAGLEQLIETSVDPITGKPTDPPLKDLAGRMLLNALLRQVYVRERPNLITYLEIVTGQLEAIGRLGTTAEEATALDNILNTTPLHFGADSIDGVFSDVLVVADNSPEISETTKANIHKLFNIPTVKTAGDLQSVLDNGYGVDSEGNKIPISTDQKLRVMPNTYLYQRPDGDRIFEIGVPGDRKYQVRFTEATSEQALYKSAFTIQVMGLMAQMDLASAIWPRGFTLQEGGVIDLHYDDIIKAERVASLSGGITKGSDARLLSETDYQQMQHNWQAFPKKGQAAEGDNNPDRDLSEYKELTIINPDGTINWIKFEQAALYLQDVSNKGGEPNFDDLKTHLIGGAELSV